MTWWLLMGLLTQLDGGEGNDAAGVVRVSRTIYLAKGNVMPHPPQPATQTPFRERCQRVAASCAFNRAVWTSEQVRVDVEPDGKFRVLRVRDASSQPSAFAACLRKGLDGQRIDAAETSGAMVCQTMDLPTSHVDQKQVLASAAQCLAKDTPIKQLDVRFAQVVDGLTVRVADLEVTATPRLDLETETCVRRAASVPDFTFTEDDRPRFTRREQHLTLHAWYPGRVAAPLPAAFIRPKPK